MLANILTSAASWDSEHPLLTYIVPAELEDSIRIGQLVAVPYGERLVEGLIWEIIALPAPSDTQIDRDLSPSGRGPIHLCPSWVLRPWGVGCGSASHHLSTCQSTSLKGMCQCRRTKVYHRWTTMTTTIGCSGLL